MQRSASDAYVRELDNHNIREMSENCLYLSIWLHAKELWGKLPVIIWIYDGGLQFSATSEMQYNGGRMASRSVELCP